MIYKVYQAQLRKPAKDDWEVRVHQDMNEIGMRLTDDEIKSMSKNNFKKTLKENILKSAFKYLQSLKTNHSKVKIIKYDKLEVQPYVTSNKLSTEEKQLLQRLRSSTIEILLQVSI